MNRLGVQITLVEMQRSLLPLDDPDAGSIIEDALGEEGVRVLTGVRCVGLERVGDGVRVRLDGADDVLCDKVLVSVGRAPNIEGLGLEAAGVDFDRAGIQVDRRHRTTNRRIYAAGDVCSPMKFTHAAYAQAEYAVFNALFGLRFNARDRVLPRVTYTDPEVATVGPTHDELTRLGTAIHTIEVPASSIDRLVVDGHTSGFARIHLKAGTDRIVGATLVCEGAGELIGEVALTMTKGLGLSAIADTVHAYPTRSELVRKAADAYNLERVTPGLRDLLRWWYRILW